MKPLLRTALTLLFIGSLAAPARADWYLTPYIGAAFGGASNQFVLNDLDDEFEQRVNFGGSFGWRSKGIFGVEVDYDVAPNFFQFTGGTNNFDLFDFDSSVQTLMGNVVIALPIGGSSGMGFHPYLTAGLGTIRTQLRSDSDVFDEITSNDSGFNVGGGAHFFLGTHFGLRADVRYIRGFESLDDEDPIADNPFFDQAIATDVFNYSRGTVGLTFRW
ncbi:MAG: outer membrane beta-barrel protein [Vicinamibacterales bacterium]